MRPLNNAQTLKNKEYYRKNKPKFQKYRHEYYLRNRKKERVYNKSKYNESRKTLFTMLGDKCYQCGFSNPLALDIDHINGDGYIDRKRFNGSASTMVYKYYLQHPVEAKTRLQILCANCNRIKMQVNREVAWHVKRSVE